MYMLHQTMANRGVFTSIIPYSSSAECVKVPRDGDTETERWGLVERQVADMRAEGGTSFRHAFDQIQRVLFGDTRGGKVAAKALKPGTREYEEQRRLGRQGLLVQGAPAFVSSVAVVFMTDGQDNTIVKNPARRSELVGQLRRVLDGWEKDVVVHTVSGHAHGERSFSR
jgi:hypothetical protein